MSRKIFFMRSCQKWRSPIYHKKRERAAPERQQKKDWPSRVGGGEGETFSVLTSVNKDFYHKRFLASASPGWSSAEKVRSPRITNSTATLNGWPFPVLLNNCSVSFSSHSDVASVGSGIPLTSRLSPCCGMCWLKKYFTAPKASEELRGIARKAISS